MALVGAVVMVELI
jgi:hypothetical protein